MSTIYIAVISSNILVVKVTGGYFACFIWPQRQGSIGKQGIYRAEQGIYENRSLLIASHISVLNFTYLVYRLMLSIQ